MDDALKRTARAIVLVNRAIKSGDFDADCANLSVIKKELEEALDAAKPYDDRLAHMEAADNLCNALFPRDRCTTVQLHRINMLRLTIFPA